MKNFPFCQLSMTALLFLLGFFNPLFAQKTWTGATSTDWNVGTNWNPAGTPAATDNVTIPNLANDPVIMGGTAASVKSVLVQAGAVFTIQNTGSLDVNGSTGFALENVGTLDNSGTIRIGNNTSVANRGIVHRNGGTLNNKASGLIRIDRTSAVEAFFTSGVVNNEGTIEIGSIAAVTGVGLSVVTGTGVFNNKTGGLLTINRTTGAGILCSGTFNNDATIEIGNLGTVGTYGISHVGMFNNNLGGTIKINRTGSGGVINFNTFTNTGNLTIGNIAISSQDCIQNQGTFVNAATGIISADRASANGIWHASGTFQNDGIIKVGSIAPTGTGILSYLPFSNNAGAEIHIDRVPVGIVSTNTFTNAGLIRIGENAPLSASGIATAGGVFNNNAGGDISIKQTAVDGVQNGANTTFNNNACARLTIFDNFKNSGAFTNAGLLTVNTAQAHTNTGLTNNGIIEYPQGNPIPNVVNNEIIVKPISGSCTISPALSLGATVDFDIATQWFLDENLTQAAGTYNPATNTFSNSDVPSGVPTTYYFSINDPVGGCERTVSIKITSSLPAETCSNGTDDDCDGMTDEGCGTPVEVCAGFDYLIAFINGLPEPPADATAKFWMTTSLEYAKMFYQMGFDDWAVAMLGPSLEYESFRYWVFYFHSANPQRLTNAQKNFFNQAALDLIAAIQNGTATCGSTRPEDDAVTDVIEQEPTASEVKMLVSPNPTAGPLSVQFFDFEKSGGDLQIFDATGRMVYHQTLEPGTTRLDLDLSENGLTNGFYTLRVRVGEQVLTRKVSVVR